MTIETLLGDLLAALKENTAAATAHTDMLKVLSTKAKPAESSAPATTAPAPKAAAAAEPEDDEAPKPRTRAAKAPAEPAPVKRAAKVKPPTEKDMVEKTKAFLDAAYEGLAEDEESDDADADFEARKAFVKKVLAKHGDGATKMSLVSEDLRQACLDALGTYEPEEDVA